MSELELCPAGAPGVVVTRAQCGREKLCVEVRLLGAELAASLLRFNRTGGDIGSVLRVDVVTVGLPVHGTVPGMVGRYQVEHDTVRFMPHFPFEPATRYRVTFDPGPLQHGATSGWVTFDFSAGHNDQGAPTVVADVYPSSDVLPENLLRFYVVFSSPMRRGHAAREIALLGPDGQPARDVLYRPPVELWDPMVRVLTVLLDPGRLKRGVGPNRALGPPLAAGQCYTLVIGAGMTDLFGRTLQTPIAKQFCVVDAVRRPVDASTWHVTAPVAGGRQALTLTFPRPLDWAMLFRAVTVISAEGKLAAGQTNIDWHEQRWRFTPNVPWIAGHYAIRIDTTLEDPCGNTLLAPFDRPARARSSADSDIAVFVIPFDVAPGVGFRPE